MNHVVIIGSGGIASALARLAHASDTAPQIMIASRNSSSANELAAAVGGQAVTVDASDSEAMRQLKDEVIAWSGGQPWGVINTAGSILLKPAHLTSSADWQQTLAQNLTSAFHTVQLATVAKGCQSALLFSSTAARIGLPNHEAIAAAKAGVEGLVRSAAASYAKRSIRFNALALGLVDTPMAAMITSREAALKASAAMHPLGRIGTAEEVAQAAYTLFTSSWVTGAVWTMDGGLSTCRS